jgi:hypothetical protein
VASNGVASSRIDDRRDEDARSMTARDDRVDDDVDAAMTVARAVTGGGIVISMLTLRSHL